MNNLLEKEEKEIEKTDPKWNTFETLQKLQEKYPAPEYAFLKEVANGTGAHGNRYADALVMSLFPSRGLYLTGFEIKTSRKDWLNELKNPQKADAIAKFCDYWFLVVGSNSIVKEGELPLTWGLIEPCKDKLRVTKQPVKLEAEPLDRRFLAAIMRRSNEKVSSPENYDHTIKEFGSSEFQRGIDYGKNWNSSKVAQLTAELEKITERISTFETISGLRIDGYNGERLAEAVKIHLDGGIIGLESELKLISKKANKIIEICQEGISNAHKM